MPAVTFLVPCSSVMKSTMRWCSGSAVATVLAAVVGVPPGSGGPPRLTATVRSVSSLKVGAMGTGLRMPPSTSFTPLISKGVKKSGSAMEARMASNSGPLVSHTSLRLAMLEATAVKLTGSSSMRRAPTSPCRVSMIRSPLTSPPPSRERSSSRRMSKRVMAFTQRTYSSSRPAAWMPPTSAPMELPAMERMA